MTTLQDLHNDIIDSRDIIDALEELNCIVEDEDATQSERNEAQENYDEIYKEFEPFMNYADWEHGETLIAETYFIEYTEELLKNCGCVLNGIPWYVAIDWEQTANNISVDYMLDNGYYMRSV